MSNTDSDSDTMLLHLVRSIQLGAVPAACMAAFTVLGLGKEVPVNIAGALQHFAAGILLCTIGTELLPEMVKAQGVTENIAAGVGFFLGVAVLILLGIFMPEEEKEENEEETTAEKGGGTTVEGYSAKKMMDGDEDAVGVQLSSISASAPPLRGKRQSIFDGVLLLPAGASSGGNRGRQSLISVARRCSVAAAALPPPAISSTTEDSPLLQSRTDNEEGVIDSTTTTTNSFPATLLSAIAIDSALDGLLIGIASVAGPSAGPMMSLSLTVEMSFLGLTLATALNGHPNIQTYPASFLGPLVLVAGAAAGGLLASMLLAHQALFIGLLSFGTSALLFMVAEELLLEAHEDGADHVWWVDLQLYVGFYASVMLGKVVLAAGATTS